MFIENLKNDVMVKENVKPKSQIEFFINKSAKEFNNDTKIYRYMDFDCFLQILDKKFYISAKKHFSDCYDAGTKVPLNISHFYSSAAFNCSATSALIR